VAVIVTVTPNPGLDRTLTVPRIVFNQMMRATASRLDWGGKGFNVSRALQALGVESVAMGFIGGATGRTLERGLGDLGIGTDFVPIAGETRTNTVITSAPLSAGPSARLRAGPSARLRAGMDADAYRYVKVNEPGPTVRTEEVAAFFDRAREKARPGDIWVLCGSLPPGVPPDFYARLTALVQAMGAQVLLDSSGEALRLGCAASPYLVKPNVVEAEEMTGQEISSDADALAAVEFFVRQGIELVALSLGADGLLLASKELAVRARPPCVQARNPVGAGDALLAGIASALAGPSAPARAGPSTQLRAGPSTGLRAGAEHSRREHVLSLEEIARWGVATGTAAAMQEGVSFGTRAEVEALYEQIRPRPAIPTGNPQQVEGEQSGINTS
jgi:1-phosphofructokinase family hexose kinase